MYYRIELTEPAEEDADVAYSYFYQWSPEFADQGFRRLLDSINGLKFMPYRYPASHRHGAGIRRMLAGRGGSRFHVFYRIIDPAGDAPGVVRILHNYHAARDDRRDPPNA